MTKLAPVHYNGEKKNFGIVKFYQLHSEAHNDLELAGEPLSDSMKITHFLQGLKDDTAMNFATALKAEPGIVTFEDFYNSFSAKLSTILSLTQSASGNSQRQIIQCNTQQQEVLSGFFLLIVLYICLKPTSLLSSIYVMLIFIPLNRKRMYSNSSKIRSSVIFPCKIE